MDFDDIIFVFGFIGTLVVIFVISFFGLSWLLYVSEQNSCLTWGQQSQREYKFVGNYPWYVDCLTKTESGWISAHKLEQIETPNIIK